MFNYDRASPCHLNTNFMSDFKEFENPWSAENSEWFENNNFENNTFELSDWSTNEWEISEWNNDNIELDNSENSCSENLGNNSLSDLLNLTIIKFTDNTFKDHCIFLIKKINERTNHINELLKLTNKEEEKEKLAFINSLYSKIKENSKKTHNELFSIYTKDKTKENISNLIELYNSIKQKEDEKLNELIGDKFNTLKKICLNTLNAYKSFLTDIIIIFEEEHDEFQRFNKLFSNNNTQNILKSNSYVTFSSPELKSLCCQETADFCNINVYGVHDKEKGYKQIGPKNSNFHGICQIGESAIKDSLKWLKSKNITILEDFDSSNKEINPQDAIWLSAAYLGCITERYLLKLLPSPIPKCSEFKKLVIASYNSNFNRTIANCKKYQLNNKNKNYSFDLIKNNYAQETRDYVAGIIKRLN